MHPATMYHESQRPSQQPLTTKHVQPINTLPLSHSIKKNYYGAPECPYDAKHDLIRSASEIDFMKRLSSAEFPNSMLKLG